MKTVTGRDIDEAARLLTGGQVVAIPTETVYGLAANALKPEAVVQIYQVKQRPSFDPLIIHIADFAEVYKYVEFVPDQIRLLADHFMPGPLTVLLKKKDIIPDIVTAGSPFVAVRVPSHQITSELLHKLDFPLAAPSANPFGYISPTSAKHVFDQLNTKIPYILDGGPSSIGIESTIVGINTDGEVEILRKGGLAIEEIEKVTGKIKVRDFSTSNPEAPGMLTSHYAPNISVRLCHLEEEIKHFNPLTTGVISFYKKMEQIPENHQVILSKTKDYAEAARNLFSGMRYLDGCQIDVILTELLPEENLGIAINDRLRRAASL